jgi:hypothetical protein
MTRRERLEARLAKREEWAAAREARSEAAFDRAHEVASGIPFGQPILVGHHSEGRARRDQARIEGGMRAGVENARAAEDHRSKAAGLESQLARTVFSDDVDAVERLSEQVRDLEAARDRIKAYNASCRRGRPDESLLDERQRADIETIRRVAPYQVGKNGSFPGYTTASLGQRIREKKQRIATFMRERAAAEAGVRVGGRVMLSRYPGECVDCGQPIERGAAITWYRSTREAVHVTCPEGGSDE